METFIIVGNSEQNHNIMLIDNQNSQSVDRVSTIFADKSRSVTLNLSKNLLMLQTNSRHRFCF